MKDKVLLPTAHPQRLISSLLTVAALLAICPPLWAQLPVPTLSAEAGASPQAQALDQAFVELWPTLLKGDFKAGLPALEALLQRSRAELGAGAATTLKLQYFHASTLHRLGRLAEAKAGFEDALALHVQAGSQDSRSALGSQAALARTVEELDGPRAALPLYEAAMAQRSRTVGDSDLESVTLLDDFASALVELGDAQTALPLLDQALAMRTQGLGPTHRWTLTTLNNRAQAYTRLGRHGEALADNETVLRHRLAQLGERDPTTLVTMNNTGVALAHLGRLEEALALHERVVGLRMALLGPHHPSTLISRRALAADLLDLGRLGEARAALQDLAEHGAAAWGPTHRHTLSARIALARSLEGLGQHAAALAELDPLLALHVQARGEDHFDTLGVAIQRARVLRRLGHADLGQQALEPLLPRLAQRYGTRMPLYAEGLAELAACQLDNGQAAQAVATLMRLPAPGGTGLVPGRAGGRAGGRAADGAPLAQGLAPAAARGHPAGPSTSSRPSLPAAPADPAQPAEPADWQRLLSRALAQQGRLAAAFGVLEAHKAARLLQSLGERNAADAAGVTALERALLQDHREHVLLLQDGVRKAREPQERQRALQGLDQATTAQQAHIDSLRQRYPLFARLTQLPAATAASAGRLPPHAVLVSYAVDSEQRVGAFTLDGKARLQWHPLGHQPGLSQSVESLRLWATQGGQRRMADDRGRVIDIVRWGDSNEPRWRPVTLDARPCANPAEAPDCRPTQARRVDSPAEYDALRQHLATRLLAPLAARLRPHAHWVVSPDGALGALPLDVLPWQGGLVAERVRVSQVQSLSALSTAADGPHRPARQAARLDLIALGNPVFGAGGDAEASEQPALAAAPAPAAAAAAAVAPAPAPAASASTSSPAATQRTWPPLPAAAAEVRNAAAPFQKHRTRVATGPQATEAHLRQLSAQGDLAQARYVLLATHAWYEHSQPGRSHLVLGATGPSPGEDGRMTATEIAGLQMRSELTVVSACNTARGEAASSAGQFGFAYGLSVAGNRNALLTLWPVGDQASAAFVGRFFHHLAAGRMGQVQALYATKREFMQHPQVAWRHPRVWAGYVLVGG